MLANAKISTKIISLLLMLGALCLGIALYSSFILKDIDHRFTELTMKVLPATTNIARADRASNQIGWAVYRTMVHDGASAEAKTAGIDGAAAIDVLDKQLQVAVELLPRIKGDAKSLEALKDRIADNGRKALALGLQNRNDEALVLILEIDKDLGAFSIEARDLNKGLIEGAEKESAALDEETERTSFMMLVVSIIGIIVALVLGFFVTRAGITAPLSRLQDVMGRLASGENELEVPGTDRADEVGAMAKTVLVFRDAAVALDVANAEKAKADAEQTQVVEALGTNLGRLAEGDLTAELTAFPANYAKLQEDFNAAVTELRSAMAGIAASTTNIHGGSGEISAASDDLSRRTEQQAASLEETAAAMTEITQTVQSSATGASEANKLVQSTQAEAQESGKVVAKAVEAMGEIESSSREITKIIAVIEKIAFQTNLLALNASVEAAHAGDAGKAFAVVANEVRALAQRSADAAQEISELISNSSRQVGNGVGLVGEAGKALERIIGQVDEISTLVSTIAMAADQQSSALAQVNSAITEMDKVTQQNAAMVEESTAAARSLADEATGLSRLVSRFSTGDQPAGANVVAMPGKPAKPERKPARKVARSRGNTAVANEDDWNEF